MKKNTIIRTIIIITILLIVAFLGINKYVVTFYYMNPYTETSTLKYIAPTIKELNEYIDKAKELSEMDGYKYDIVYTNAYGSGFLRKNPIPNDLDFDIFIDLGTFDYDADKTAKDIAKEIVNEMDSFQYSLTAAINMDEKQNTLTYRSLAGQFKYSENLHDRYVEDIAKNIDNAISLKKYIIHPNKKSIQTGKTLYYIPYVLQPGQLMLKDYDSIMLHNNEITYNKDMPKYIRKISAATGFTANIKRDNKISKIEIIPELFSTGPLNLNVRMFAPNVFTKPTAVKFLKELPEYTNDEAFFDTLMFCFLDHFSVIYPADGVEYNPLKAMKRLLQVVDMIEPALPKEDVKEIYNAVSEEWSNRDIVLLNEFDNITTNLIKIYTRPILFGDAIENGDVAKLLSIMNSTIDELKNRKNVNPEFIRILNNFKNEKIKEMLTKKDYTKLSTWERAKYDRLYRTDIAPIISKAVLSQMKNQKLLEKHIQKLRQLCDDAGYKQINIYTTETTTIQMEENEFTKSIKDFKDFARKNNLADDVEYKVLPKSKIAKYSLKYDIWVRYNTTPEQDKNFEQLKKTLINYKSQFKVKQKHVISF